MRLELLKELVLEMISNAYENGFYDEVNDLSDKQLAEELCEHSDVFCDYTLEDVVAAVKEFRNVH